MIQYKHYKTGTLSVGIPEIDRLKKMLETHSQFLDVSIGIAFKHPNERHNKKLGREYANKNLRPLSCKFLGVELRKEDKGNRLVYCFYLDVPNNRPYGPKFSSVEFGISTVSDCDYARLEYADVEDTGHIYSEFACT